jgi:hypothetical protein
MACVRPDCARHVPDRVHVDRFARAAGAFFIVMGLFLLGRAMD